MITAPETIKLFDQDAYASDFSAAVLTAERAEAARHHLTTVRRAMVRPNPALPFHRAMVEYGYGTALATDEIICIETGEHGIYSPEYIALTREFYLKF